MNSGVYALVNKVNGKVYVGSSARVNERWSHHFGFLKRGTHPNPHLQAAFDKYGESAWAKVMLAYHEGAGLLGVEKLWIKRLRSTDRKYGYNCTDDTLSPMKGKKHSLETRRKMSNARMGREVSPETRAKIVAGNLGKTRSEETKRRIRASKLGTTRTEKTKATMSDAQRARRLRESTTIRVPYEGRLLTLHELSEATGIKRSTLFYRYRRGQDLLVGAREGKTLTDTHRRGISEALVARSPRARLTLDVLDKLKVEHGTWAAVGRLLGMTDRAVAVLRSRRAHTPKV